MVANVYPSRSAERAIFVERYESPAKVHANGGTLIGGCIPKNGLPLDGTQYATRAIAGLLAGRSTVAFEMEFWPDTDFDADALVNLWSTTSDDYRVYKTNNAGGNKLGIVLGGTLIEEVLPAAYSAAWVVGGRNVLIVSSNGASTDAWLNGTQILTADATAWTPTNPATLYTGALADGSGKLEGTVKRISIRARLISDLDAQAIQADSIYTYPNRSQLYCSFSRVVIDGSDDYAIDKSRFGRTVLLGDGAGTGTPAFQNPGLLFDGVNNKLTLPPDPTGTFTVAWRRRNEATVFESNLTTWNLLNAAGGFEGHLDYLAHWDFELSPIQEDDLDLLWRGNR